MNNVLTITDPRERRLSLLQGLTLEMKMPDGRIKKVEGRFDSIHIPHDSYPEDYHHYGIRHSGSDDTVPATLEKAAWVNHYGDFLTREDLGEAISASGGALQIIEWDFT